MDVTVGAEIFSKRLISAVIWNIGFQVLIAFTLVFFIQIDILHPINWLVSVFNIIFGWRMGLNIFLLMIVSFIKVYVYGNYYSISTPKYLSRFALFINVFSIKNLIFCALYALSGCFTIVLYSSLARSYYVVFKKPCEQYDGQCLREESIFLYFGGMWIGLYYFLNTYMFGTAVLVFPHIYQKKLQQLKLSIFDICLISFQKSFTPVVFYALFYYVFGNKMRSLVSYTFSLYLEDPPLDQIFNLLTSYLCLSLWMLVNLFFISIHTMKTVFNIVLTEPKRFQIESNVNMNLNSALSRHSFVGYLAAYDLKYIGKMDKERRAQIFSLSYPGGHPKNWTNLMEASLFLIKEFNAELNAVNDTQSIDVPNISKNFNTASNTSGSSYNIRNMAPFQLHLSEKYDQNRNNIDFIMAYVKQKIEDAFQKIVHKSCNNYFFGEIPDVKLKILLLQSQPVIWTCEGLACLAAASLTEDKYGIVQNDLPAILSALVDLKISLEKLNKQGLVNKKNAVNELLCAQMKTMLMSSVKRSLYIIVITFSNYINELPLDSYVQASIQPFLFCKEP